MLKLTSKIVNIATPAEDARRHMARLLEKCTRLFLALNTLNA